MMAYIGLLIVRLYRVPWWVWLSLSALTLLGAMTAAGWLPWPVVVGGLIIGCGFALMWSMRPLPTPDIEHGREKTELDAPDRKP